jgi:hypothetical protein
METTILTPYGSARRALRIGVIWLLFWPSLLDTQMCRLAATGSSLSTWAFVLSLVSQTQPSAKCFGGIGSFLTRAEGAALHLEWSNLTRLTPASHSSTNIGPGLVMTV